MHYPNQPASRPIDTSIEAAKTVASKANSLRTDIYQLLLQLPQGLDTYNISRKLGIEFHQAHPRLAELHTAGMIQDSGKRVLNPITKRKIAVWVVTQGEPVKFIPKRSRAKIQEEILKDCLVEFQQHPILYHNLIKRIERVLNG